MSAPFQSKDQNFRCNPVALAGVAASLLLAMNPSAIAAGLASDEVKRKPVVWQAVSQCAGTQHVCNISFGSTPTAKNKRLEIAGVSCRMRIYSGEVVGVSLEGGTTQYAYEFLEPVHTGTHNGNELYVARSVMRYFAPIGDEIKAYVSATGDLSQFFCTLQGTMVTYQ